MSLAFLAYAFYEAYRPNATACVGDNCEVPLTRRYRRIALWVVAVTVAALLTAPWWASWVIYWTLYCTISVPRSMFMPHTN